MQPKRRVSANLGRTQHRDADEIYDGIRRRRGGTRRCPFYGGKKYPQYGPEAHDELNPDFPNPYVPIEQFDFAKKGDVWDLQAYCKVCYKVYRELRKQKARSQWVNSDGSDMSDDDIRQWFRDNVGPEMECSYGNHWEDPSAFRVSKNMEKGLHNVCLECEPMTRLAQGLREKEWLAGGDWNSWALEAERIRGLESVQCVGWPLSVQFGHCKGELPGRRMHLDHIIPLRCGGVHDARNLQPMCGTCNIKKTDQIQTDMTYDQIISRIGADYHHVVNQNDSIQTIERKLKAHLENRILTSIQNGSYEQEVRDLKRRVNGQWVVDRVVKKGGDWARKQR